MLHQMVYFSSATEPMPKSKLYKILLVSRKNNARLDVTGLLVYVDGFFVQFLEGEREVVQALMKKISLDNRHTGVKIAYEGDVGQRSFASWRMAYVATSAQELATWAGLHNTTTIEETLDYIRSHPGRVPQVTEYLLQSMKRGEPDLTEAD